jgi:hypothetical protein
MAAPEKPPGWSYNPSAWSERMPVLVLALAGFGIATYLGLYQLNVVPEIWEPFFGKGSYHILKESSIANLLPVPDAVLGAIVYLLDAAAGAIGGSGRWHTMPWIVLLLGVMAAGLALGGVLLAIFQPVLFHAYCTLCLGSAACSIFMVGFVMAEVLAALQFLKREREQGCSAWRALGGKPLRHGVNGWPGTAAPEGRGKSLVALVVSASLGIWLMADPAILAYTGSASTIDHVVGPIVAACSIIALHEVGRPLCRVNQVIGLWLLLAPWALGYGFAPFFNSTVVGLLLISCAVVRGTSRERLGGGWSALWKTSVAPSG